MTALAEHGSKSHAAALGESGRRRLRRRRALWLLALALLLVCAASIMLGTKPIAPGTVWQALTDPAPVEDHIIVRSLRLPRTLLGLCVGLALGVAGSLIQAHTRNPLADPGLLGVNQGAAFAVVAAVVVLDVQSLYGYIWFGFAGALLASCVVFALGSIGGSGSTPITLTLAGAAVSALLNGLIAAIVLGNRQGMETYRFWHVGSIASRDYAVLGQVLPFIVVGLVLALASTSGMNALALGTDVAKALGQNVRRTRVVGILAITLLTGAAVGACGPIAFLGLLAPHLARMVTGPDYRWLVPCAALTGAVLIITADVLSRVISGDTFEVGIMIAIIGAPVFVFMVHRKGVVRI
ncbi:iron chelate uptake ABC transporter family permease subunit [Streptomyces sp. NPDC088124]|uniref:FecCD family ABC transporter permease n=1 Tax=Streptomyces sp. NPDC088124 TaxID=3154654 RepID=UPI003429B298